MHGLSLGILFGLNSWSRIHCSLAANARWVFGCVSFSLASQFSRSEPDPGVVSAQTLDPAGCARAADFAKLLEIVRSSLYRYFLLRTGLVSTTQHNSHYLAYTQFHDADPFLFHSPARAEVDGNERGQSLSTWRVALPSRPQCSALQATFTQRCYLVCIRGHDQKPRAKDLMPQFVEHTHCSLCAP